MKKMLLLICISGVLVACGGKPSGVSDKFWGEYKDLGAPKVMYQCGDEVGYSAGVGMNATYNRLVSKAKDSCRFREFKILHSQQ